MINGRYIGIGLHSITFRLDDGSALKVFNSLINSKQKAEEEFENMRMAHNLKLNVPEPYEVVPVKLNRENLRDVGKWARFKHEVFGVNCILDSMTEEWNMEYEKQERVNYPNFKSYHSFYALRKEFIEGQCLDEYFFPHRAVREKMIALHRSFDLANLVAYDIFSRNYVLTKNNDLFYIDCEALVPKPANPDKAWIKMHKFFNKHSPICCLEDFAMDSYCNGMAILSGETLC